jgi:hypothetical protein
MAINLLSMYICKFQSNISRRKKRIKRKIVVNRHAEQVLHCRKCSIRWLPLSCITKSPSILVPVSVPSPYSSDKTDRLSVQVGVGSAPNTIPASDPEASHSTTTNNNTARHGTSARARHIRFAFKSENLGCTTFLIRQKRNGSTAR